MMAFLRVIHLLKRDYESAVAVGRAVTQMNSALSHERVHAPGQRRTPPVPARSGLAAIRGPGSRVVS